ncbi:MAG: CoA transferase [Chloroflexaceae bacterium]|jgi:crotonobetainyl-CoA:carnitine CoA-transferase CaiB-like acyl-CoA transferase|nr:CoA transferase [Chloroflexaceae bacterium]
MQLSDITVIEVAAYIPGPLCTQILADMGATVIKIERPEGDPMRQLEPRTPSGDNAMFLAFNRGKRSLTLNLKATEDVARLRELAHSADVLVDGFRPGVLARLGLGADSLRAANPRLVYCALSGYGSTGPQAQRAGHDLNFVALSGFLGNTSVGGVPAMPGTQLADMVSGLRAATAILAALHERTRTGLGATLDVSLHEAATWLMTPWWAVARSGSPVPPEGSLLTGERACYRLYRTADGRYLAVAALEFHFWHRFCMALGREDLVPLHADLAAQPHAIAEVSTVIATQPLHYWEERFRHVDACVSPVLTVEEAAGRGTENRPNDER